MKYFLIDKAGDLCEAAACEINILKFSLESNNDEIITDINNADKIIFIGCTFVDYLIEEYKEYLINFKKENILIYGCAKRFLTEYNKFNEDLVKKHEVSYFLTKIDEMPKVLVNRGCTNNCSFCNVKLSNPKLQSVQTGLILSKILTFVNAGHKEILLVGDDIGSYGLDINSNLSLLLESIYSIFPDITINIRHINPDKYIEHYEIINELIRKKYIKSIRIHLQSGSNNVLKLMNRKYSIEDFESKWNLIDNKKICSVSVFMIRYPNESFEDFKASIRMAKNFMHPLFIQYSINKETESFKQLEGSNYFDEELIIKKETLLKRYIRRYKLKWKIVS